MDRRAFMATGLAAGAAVSMGTFANHSHAAEPAKRSAKRKFKLKYAPYFGMFRNHVGDDPIDQLKFMADEGFRAAFDNEIADRSKQQQKAIASQMERLNMMLGPFIACAEFERKTFVTSSKHVRRKLIEQMNNAVQVSKRVNCKWALVVPGAFDAGLEWEYQTANVIDNLKYCAEVCEPAGVIMVIEPLNPWRDHPGLFLTRIPQAYQICRAVGSGSCKILNDLYHQQITEGNLIPNIDMAWEEIAAFHLGDTPGRMEPTTGEINYKNIFKHLYEKGYEGVLCMEHGQSKEGKDGERAVIEAYRVCDNF
jgi:hydroxypyruvate isomerase